jgi:hypothetical protein
MIRLRKRSVFRPRVIQPPSVDDTRGATPERMRQAQGFVERGNLGRGRTGIVTMRDSPIERARARNVINQAQYTAAVKYRHHWYRAGLASPLSSVELGVAVSKNLRRWLVKLRANPRQAIEGEIAELKGLLDKYRA